MLRYVAVSAALLFCVAPADAFSPSGVVLRSSQLRSAVSSAAPALRTMKRRGMGSSLWMTATTDSDTEVEQVLEPNSKRSKTPPIQPVEKMIEDCAWIIPKDDMDLKARVDMYVENGDLTEGDRFILMNWFDNYKEALDTATNSDLMRVWVALTEEGGQVKKERNRPHYFNNDKETGVCYEPRNSHASDSKFFDYHHFGVDFTRPMVDWPNCKILGLDNLNKIKQQLADGDNVVFLSNHQSESDTHCIFTLFEDQLGPEFGELGRNIVFMAGERVLRDPHVVPFSRGCNLLTVYSKKHIDSEPEIKQAKMQHNQRSMKQLGQLFAKGGTCMWYAPSGGRDRRDAESGKVEPAMFDPNAIEMVRLVAEGAGAGAKTHMYPMALATHNIFPPPATVGGAFGEERRVQFSQLSLAVCDEVIDEPLDPELEGMEARKAVKQLRVDRCKAAYKNMKEGYIAIGGYDQ